MSSKPFLTDVKTLRERARKHIEQGAVTEGYSADRETVIKVLNEALATEIVCVLRYRRHYFMASGINADSVAAEFLQQPHQFYFHRHMFSVLRRVSQNMCQTFCRWSVWARIAPMPSVRFNQFREEP